MTHKRRPFVTATTENSYNDSTGLSVTITDHSLTINWPLTNHSLNTHSPFSDHSLTINWPLTNHSLTIHSPLTDHSLTIHWLLTYHSATIHWPLTDHSATIHWPLTIHWLLTYHSVTIHWPLTNHSLTTHSPFSDYSLTILWPLTAGNNLLPQFYRHICICHNVGCTRNVNTSIVKFCKLRIHLDFELCFTLLYQNNNKSSGARFSKNLKIFLSFS